MPSRTFLWRSNNVELMVEGLSLCLQKLEKYKAPGNEKVNEKYEYYLWLRGYLAKTVPPGGGFHSRPVTLDDAPLVMIKTALLVLAADIKNRRSHVLATAEISDGATEALDQKLQFIEDFVNGPILAELSVDAFFKPPAHAEIPATVLPLITDPELNKTVRALSDEDHGVNDRAMNDASVVLEERVRQTAGLGKEFFGDGLIDKALRPKTGILVLSEVDNEQEGWQMSFKGFLKAIRNPTGHGRVTASKLRAAQAISFADFLIQQLQVSKRR